MTKGEAVIVLGLPPIFTARVAKSAYREAAHIAHPDKGGSHEAMKQLNEAYGLVCAGLEFGFVPAIDVGGVEFKAFRPKPSLGRVVNWFTDRMTKKLMANRHKKFSWRGETAQELFRKLRKECTELEEAIEGRDKEEIIKECADVANFAMMIADNAKRKLK